jgi:hypothetical protein
MAGCWPKRPAFAILLLTLLISWTLVTNTGDRVDVEKILAEALRRTSRSWEAGALAEALLELRDPELSIFSPEPFRDGDIPCHAVNGGIQALEFAKQYIWINDTDTLTNGEGKQGRNPC